MPTQKKAVTDHRPDDTADRLLGPRVSELAAAMSEDGFGNITIQSGGRTTIAGARGAFEFDAPHAALDFLKASPKRKGEILNEIAAKKRKAELLAKIEGCQREIAEIDAGKFNPIFDYSSGNYANAIYDQAQSCATRER